MNNLLATPNSEAKQAILAELPAIPARDLSRLVPVVVRKSAESFGEMTGNAIRNIVAAYIRHTYTDYDRILKFEKRQLYGEAWSTARATIQPAVSEMLHKWEGEHKHV